MTNLKELCSMCDGYATDVECDMKVNCKIARVVEELARYKNLKKEGRLMELPCRVGDIVYSIDTFSISEWSVMSISITVFNRNIEVMRYGIGIYRTFDEFKEQFYTTREEAEKALVEMEGK